MAEDTRLGSMAEDFRRLNTKRRRDIAHRFLDAWRAVREETGYGAMNDAVVWAQRVVEGRDE